MSSTGGPKAARVLGFTGDELQGQYRIPDGEQCMQFTQIASDGGLLPLPITRDYFELWPAKRREVIIDFTKYQDGTSTTKGDVVYLTNVLKMTTVACGQLHPFSPDPNYKIPMIKFVIGQLPEASTTAPCPSGPAVDDAGAAAGSVRTGRTCWTTGSCSSSSAAAVAARSSG